MRSLDSFVRTARGWEPSTPSGLAALALICVALAACEDSSTDLDASCTVVGEITVGQTLPGRLSSSDCQEGGHYSDRWRLRLPTQATVRIDLHGQDFDPYLELRSESNVTIASNDDWMSLDSRIEQTLSAGTYVVVARGYSAGATGAYQLSVSDRAACAPQSTLVIGEPVSGELESTDCRGDWNAPEDRWTLQVSQARRLRLDLKSTAFDEVLLVRDAQGYVVHGSDWNHPAGHARIDAELYPGSWTISVTAAVESQRGSYELVVDLPPPCAPGVDLVINETVEGEITQDDCFFQGFWAPADSFGIVLTAETPVRLHMKGVGFQTFLILRDLQGQDVATSFGPFTGPDARIRTSLAPGRYALFAAGEYPYGSYSLDFEEDVCAQPQAIGFGASVTGTLDIDDCVRSGGAFQERWELVLSSDATARIDLSSTAFDPYLILMDAAGNLLESDDDDGPGYDARIDRALAAGTYVIAASSYQTGAVGSYTLSVGAPPASVDATVDDTPSETKPAPLTQLGSAPMSAPEPTWRSLLGATAQEVPKMPR